MSDTNQDRPRRKKTTKKKRTASASAEPLARPRKRRRREPEPPPEQQWTSGHMIMALVVGLGVGGLGGYYGAGDKGATASKDTPAGSAAGPAANNPAADVKGQPNARPTPAPGKPVYIALNDTSPRHGPKNAKVTILEYSDFQ